jgi:hypothetical protein
MLAFRGMNGVRQLRTAGLTAFIASFLALNCGEQEFNLLPLDQENGRGGEVPPPMETGGNSSGGRSSGGGRGPTGGAGAGRGGMSSVPQCEPPVCCSINDDCFDDRRPFCLGGVCQECYLVQAGQEYRPIGCAKNELCANNFRCVPSCEDEACPGQLKCAPNSQCVECLEHEHCSQNEYRKLCWGYACVMCRSNADCPAFMVCNGFNSCV